MFLKSSQGPAYVHGKLKTGDSILEVFNKHAEVFFLHDLSKAKENFPQIWQHGIIGLTLKRKSVMTHTPIAESYHALRESPTSFPDFVLVPNNGRELNAHKMVLAGEFVLHV
jgi:hypothetical protein